MRLEAGQTVVLMSVNGKAEIGILSANGEDLGELQNVPQGGDVYQSINYLDSLLKPRGLVAVRMYNDVPYILKIQ